MSSDVTIKFDGIDGESSKPKGEIDVISWNWPMQDLSTEHMGAPPSPSSPTAAWCRAATPTVSRR